MGGCKGLNAVVSKCQCEIVKNCTRFFLRDKSSNSIWVNGNKVGKDNMWPLEHNLDMRGSSQSASSHSLVSG